MASCITSPSHIFECQNDWLGPGARVQPVGQRRQLLAAQFFGRQGRRVEWDRCFQCGRKMKYKPGLGRFCRVEFRETFDSGAKPYAAKRVPNRLAA